MSEDKEVDCRGSHYAMHALSQDMVLHPTCRSRVLRLSRRFHQVSWVADHVETTWCGRRRSRDIYRLVLGKVFCIEARSGLMRDFEAKELWLHAAVRRGRIQLKKVDGTASPADLFAKYLSNPEIDKHLCTMNLRRIQVCKDDSTATST